MKVRKSKPTQNKTKATIGVKPILFKEIKTSFFTSGESKNTETFIPPVAQTKRNSQLPEDVQSKMERSMGEDFSSVKIHTQSKEAESLNALAYTQGENIHFAPGQFKPNSTQGQVLIGHELAHVKQQRVGKVTPTAYSQGKAINNEKSLEQEADVLGQRAVQNEYSTHLTSNQTTATGSTMQLTAKPGVVQMWQDIGSERYESSPQTSSGVGAIAGVPQPGEGTVVTHENIIEAGSEGEWRALLAQDDSYSVIRLYGFLRSAVLNDAEFVEHVNAYPSGNPAQTRLLREVGSLAANSSRRINLPTDRQKMALAKALYMRGGRRISGLLTENPGMAVLMNTFLQTWQPRVLNMMAEYGNVIGPEGVEPLANAASSTHRFTMIGSAFGSITQGALLYKSGTLATDATRRGELIQHGTRLVRNAGHLARGVAHIVSDIRTEQQEMFKNIIGLAITAVPLPGAGTLIGRAFVGSAAASGDLREAIEAVVTTGVNQLRDDAIKDHVISALIEPEAEQRVARLRTEAQRMIQSWNLGEQEATLINTLDSAII